MYVSGYWTTCGTGEGTAEARGVSLVPLLPDRGDHFKDGDHPVLQN